MTGAAPNDTAKPTPQLTVIGNPGSRRITRLCAAARSTGLPGPVVVPWRELLVDGADALPELGPHSMVRIDSPGEDPAVHTLLRGTDRAARVEGGARWYRHVTAAARTVARWARASGATLLDDPEDLAALCDKRRCHARLRHGGVPVPDSPTSGVGAPEVGGWEDVRAAGLSRFFVKPAHGSSTAGVLAVESAGGGRLQAFTCMRSGDHGELLNSFRVRRLTHEAEIAALVDALAPDGIHVERWWPRATQRGQVTDLRVVVTARRATHALLRASSSPLTALHSGSVRGNLAAAQEQAGPYWAAALEICERAAACFPGTLCTGVDLLPGAGWRQAAVGEVNAFGDLLPGVTGLPGGGAEQRTTHEAQLSAVLGGWRPGPAAPSGGGEGDTPGPGRGAGPPTPRSGSSAPRAPVRPPRAVGPGRRAPAGAAS